MSAWTDNLNLHDWGNYFNYPAKSVENGAHHVVHHSRGTRTTALKNAMLQALHLGDPLEDTTYIVAITQQPDIIGWGYRVGICGTVMGRDGGVQWCRVKQDLLKEQVYFWTPNWHCSFRFVLTFLACTLPAPFCLRDGWWAKESPKGENHHFTGAKSLHLICARRKFNFSFFLISSIIAWLHSMVFSS